MTSTPTVLIPGLLCSSRLYDPLLPVAWAHGAVTIADTRRDDHVAGVASRLLDGAPPRFVLVGLSMGGYTALEVLRRAPERVAGLALISTSARPDTPEQQAGRVAQREAVERGGFDELVEAVFPVLVDPAHVDDEAIRRTWVAMAHEVGPEAFLAQLRLAVSRPDSRQDLGRIDCPAAVIHGTGDRLLTPDNGEELAAGIPDASLTMVDGGGHMLPQERPEETASALGALLDRVASL